MLLTLEDILVYWNIMQLSAGFIYLSYCAFLFIHLVICLIKKYRSTIISQKDNAHPTIISGWSSFSTGFFILVFVGIIVPSLVFSHEILSDDKMRTGIINVLIYYAIFSLFAASPFYFRKNDKISVMGCTSILAIIMMLLLTFYMMVPVLFDAWVFCFPFLVFFCIHFFAEGDASR